MHDFDQVDKYLLNPKVLFNNVKDLQQVEQDFHFLTDEQKKALALFGLPFKKPDSSLTQTFHYFMGNPSQSVFHIWQYAETKNLAYEGLLYRKMADEIEQIKQNAFIESYDTFVFVGFNALNPCEKAFSLFKNTEKALFWDYDTFYTETKYTSWPISQGEYEKLSSVLLPDEEHSLRNKRKAYKSYLSLRA